MADPVLANVQRQLQLTPTGTERHDGEEVWPSAGNMHKTILKPADRQGLLTEKLKTNEQTIKTPPALNYSHLKCTVVDAKVATKTSH